MHEFDFSGIDMSSKELVSVVHELYHNTESIDFEAMEYEELIDIINEPKIFNLDTTYIGAINLMNTLDKFELLEYEPGIWAIFDMIHENIKLGGVECG